MKPLRILFCTTDERGHLNPLLGIAQHLEEQGHSLAFFSQFELGERTRAAGLGARTIAIAGSRPAAAASRPGAPSMLDRVSNPAWVRRLYEHELLTVVPGQISALERVVDELEPDVLCTDGLMYAGAIVATKRQLPWAGIPVCLPGAAPDGWRSIFTDVAAALAEPLAALSRPHGVELRRRYGDAISPWLNTLFSTETFTPRALPGKEYAFYVGPSTPRGTRGDEPDFPWERLREGRPLVYVSSGSQLTFSDTQLAALDAGLPADADVVLTLADPTAQPCVPARMIAVRYAPQRALLARAALMVSHGGANSVLESLGAGCPLLVIPLFADQPFNAELVARAGVGVHLPPAELSADRVRAATSALADPAVRARASAIARSFREADGALTTAKLIVELARSRRPLVPS